jgi:hypothetical protein
LNPEPVPDDYWNRHHLSDTFDGLLGPICQVSRYVRVTNQVLIGMSLSAKRRRSDNFYEFLFAFDDMLIIYR